MTGVCSASAAYFATAGAFSGVSSILVVQVGCAYSEQSAKGRKTGDCYPSTFKNTKKLSQLPVRRVSVVLGNILNEMSRRHVPIVVVVVLIVGPKLFIEPGTKAFFQLSSVSDPGL